MEEPNNELVDLLSTIHIFNMLSEEQLFNLADHLDTQLFKTGEIIFTKGSQADGFYIISSGRISLHHGDNEVSDECSILQRGDYFGEEGLQLNQTRKLTAVAATNVIVHRIKTAQIQELADQYPEITGPIRLSIVSYKLFLSQKLNWLAPRESIQFISRKHSVILWWRMVFPLILGGISFAITAFLNWGLPNPHVLFEIIFILNTVAIAAWLIWTIMDWANDFSIITNRRVVSFEKVALFYESRQEAPLDAILSIETRTSQIGRFFGFGDILIRTFTGVVSFRFLAHPELVIRLINEERSKAKILSKKFQRNTKEDLIRNRLGFNERELDPFEDQEPQDQVEVPPSVVSGKLSSLLATFFRLRSEENGIITYRTHWFILLKKVLTPTLLLILLFLLFIFAAFGIFTIFKLINLIVFEAVSSIFILAWWFYQYFDWRNDRYIITRDQIVDINKKPLGHEDKRAAPIKNIQTVEYKRKGLISIILNFGTVFIRVGDTTFTFDYVYNPSETQSEIFSRYQKYLGDQKQRDQDNLRQEMSDWIEIYHRVVQNGGTPPPPPSSGEISGYNMDDYLEPLD